MIPNTPGCDDELISCAHTLLKALEPDDVPDLATIRVATLAAEIEGTAGGGLITINRRGSFYARGDLLALACLIHHEHQHVSANADEHRAFVASLKFCYAHAAPPWLVQRVWREWQIARQPEDTLKENTR